MSKQILLPRKNKEGKPRFSYSQHNSWRELKSFNLGKKGRLEYICQYFMDIDFGDIGWARFGKDVESYICERNCDEGFSEKEKYQLETIETLGVFQKEFEIDFGDFVFVGIIDDCSEDFKVIRDYKTASLNSSKKFDKDTYTQLDWYAMWVFKEFGFIPKMEVCIIERLGNCMLGGGRDVLSVGGSVWWKERFTSEEKFKELEADLRLSVQEVSDHYRVYNLINK